MYGQYPHASDNGRIPICLTATGMLLWKSCLVGTGLFFYNNLCFGRHSVYDNRGIARVGRVVQLPEAAGPRGGKIGGNMNILNDKL